MAMDFLDFTADENDNGRRLDRIVRRLMPNHSLGMVYKYLRKGLVRQNGGKAKPDSRVASGDTISIAAFLLQDSPASDGPGGERREEQTPELKPRKRGGEQKASPQLELGTDLFLNSHIRIINKPYDIPVQGGGGSSISLDKLILRDYLLRQQESGLSPSLSFRPGPLHRLDRKTTGVLAFSQSLLGAQWFSQALKDHLMGKEYLAIVEGRLAKRQHWQEEILRPRQKGDSTFHQSVVSPEGKEADTVALPLGWGKFRGKDITLLHIVITTGRTHQIRLHCSHHGFPLLGDTSYGGSPLHGKTGRHHRKSLGSEPPQQELFLHAWKLSIPRDNPLSLPPQITAPIPEIFQNMLATHLPEIDLNGYII